MVLKSYGIKRQLAVWILGNFLGVAGIGLVYFSPFVTSIRGIPWTSLAIGLPIGIGQWIAFRSIAPISWLWIFTIPIGLTLGIMASIRGLWGFLDDESILALTLGAAPIAFCVGLVQWPLLWRHLGKTWIWPVSSTLGLGLGIGLILVSNMIDVFLLPILIVTLVYSLLTGLAIAWMPITVSMSNTGFADTT
jgi:hypothetical protein